MPNPKYQWSASRRRYLQNGRAVPESRIRGSLQAAIDSAKDSVGKFTQEFIDGKITRAEWAVRMRDEIRASHRAAAMLANGGKLDAKAAGKLGSQVKEQFGYLNNFINQLDNGEIELNGRVLARAQMYIQAARTTYENQVIFRESRAGVAYGRWELGAAEHCAGCIEQSDRGVQPLEDFPAIGSRECRVNCRCSIVMEGR